MNENVTRKKKDFLLQNTNYEPAVSLQQKMTKKTMECNHSNVFLMSNILSFRYCNLTR
jgi:hypothetical protein